MGRLILVSNRLPVTIRGSASNPQVDRSTGGLVSGLNPLHLQGDGLWIGYSGTDPTNSKIRELLVDMRLEAVDIPEAEYTGYYEGFSNSAIWPLFHYLLE